MVAVQPGALLPMLGAPLGVALGELVPIAFLAANREAPPSSEACAT